MKITLDTEFSKVADYPKWGVRTLAEAYEDIKRQLHGDTRLLKKDDEENLSEHVFLFERALLTGRDPTIGQVLAAWYWASYEKLVEDFVAEDSTMTNRQFGARKAALGRKVFR